MRIANVEMEQSWNGPEGEQWSRNAERYERSTRLHWQRFQELVEVAEDARVLDVGCGNGRSSCEVALRASAGDVLGIDLSAPMLARAAERATRAGLTNVRFERGDAQVVEFHPAARDLVISTFGVMFFSDPVAAFANIRTALRPGGRLAMLVWQSLDRNPWISLVRDALAAGRDLPQPSADGPGPLALADPQRVKQLLAAAGYGDVTLTGIEQPMDYGPDPDEAFAFVSGLGMTRALLTDLDDATATDALAGLRKVFEDHSTPSGVMVDSASWLITAGNPG